MSDTFGKPEQGTNPLQEQFDMLDVWEAEIMQAKRENNKFFLGVAARLAGIVTVLIIASFVITNQYGTTVGFITSAIFTVIGGFISHKMCKKIGNIK